MKSLTKILLLFLIPTIGFSQNVPDLDWREVDFPGHFPFGNIFNPNTGHQSQEESGEDWWYDIVPMVDDQGRKNGFITSGYASWLELEIDETPHDDGCYKDLPLGPANCTKPLVGEQKLSHTISMIGKYDLAGTMLWCKSYSKASEGAVSVISTSDGNYVFVGWGEVTRNMDGNVIPLNPTSGNSGYDIAELHLCEENKAKALVGKINSNGDLLWLNQYSFEDINDSGDTEEAAIGVRALDAIEMANGEIKVIGSSSEVNSDGIAKFFLFNLESNGDLIPDSRKLVGNEGFQAEPRDIHKDDNGGFYISGGQHMPSGNTYTDAVLFKVNSNNDILPFSNYSFDGSTALIRYNTNNNLNRTHIGHDVRVLDNDKIVWSLIEDCEDCRGSGTKNIGQGKVLLYDLTNSTFSWINLQSINTLGFNEVRAFDLKIGLTKTYDGGFALVTTIQEDEFPDVSDLISDLSVQVGLNCDEKLAKDIKVWNTNAYVARFDKNGILQWDKSFDSDDQAPTAHPGDIKKQECVYRIAEAEDGSLAIVGNTSHNIDDYFIAKIGSDCNLNQEYDYEPDVNNQVVFNNPGQTILINSSNVLRAKGEWRIKANTTLIIDGTTIEFADSRKSDITTKLIVERGGRLELINGAKLTSISVCPGSMWDGVEVWGDKDESQNSGIQGKMLMEGSTIENSIFGITLVKRIGWNMQYDFTGGILVARESNFINNVRSVEFRPYVYLNQSSSGLVPISNVSQIIDCDFTVDGLNDPEQYYGYNSNNELKPRSHDAFIYLDGIRNVKIQGNRFINNDPMAEGEFRGKGIYAWNSTFKVTEFCSSNQPFGQPCPIADRVPNVFENLHNGIHVRPMGSSPGILIKGSEFTNNDYGIVFEGSDNFADIHSNIFRINENLNIPEQYGGIYLESASGFKIENNTFEGLNQTVAGSNGGIHVSNSSYITSSEIYRNNFDLLDLGIQSRKNNSRMQVDCNTFTHSNSGIDWHNAANGLISDQGFCGNSLEDPHANFFGGPYLPQGSDFQVLNQGIEFKYFSYSDNNYLPQNNLVNNVNIVSCGPLNSSIEEVCPSKIPRIGFEEEGPRLKKMDSILTGIDDILFKLKGIKDSTFESETESEKASNESSYQSLLKNKDYYKNEVSQIINNQVRMFLQEDKIDSAVILLESRYSIESSLAILPLLKLSHDDERIEYHLQIISNDAAQREIINPNDLVAKEERAIISYYDLLLKIERDTSKFNNITDSQIGQIGLFIDKDVAMATHFNNLLVYVQRQPEERKLWSPISFGKNNQGSTLQDDLEITQNAGVKDISLLLYPNPTSDELNISYIAEDESGVLKITIHNLLGNEVFQKELINHRGNIKIETNRLTNGVYIVNLRNSSGVIKTEKLVIQQ